MVTIHCDVITDADHTVHLHFTTVLVILEAMTTGTDVDLLVINVILSDYSIDAFG